MASFSKATWLARWGKVRAELSHAFQAGSVDRAWTGEDAALLQRVAEAVVTRKMAAPAVVFLESLGPMSFLGSQALHILSPIMEMAFDAKDLARVAVLLERRDAISRLIALIEAASSPQGAEV